MNNITDSDVEWTRALLDSLKDGGRWAIPATQSVYRVDKRRQVLNCESGLDPVMHGNIGEACRRIGWTVTATGPSPTLN